MVLAVAAVLVLSLRSLSREKGRLLSEFANAQQSTAGELASDLENRLRDLEEDARVIATLVRAKGEVSQSDRPDEAQTMLASFRAMATVVRHYRSLALFGAAKNLRLSATDPSETHETAAALMEMSRSAAEQPASPLHLTGPIAVSGGRYFYLYRFPVGSDLVVIAIDGPRLLQSALRSVPDGRVVVTDPEGGEWIGCGATTPCKRRLAAGRTEQERAWNQASGTAWVDGPTAAGFGLRRDAAVAAWVTAGSQALGSWRVLLVASAAALQVREQTLGRQFLLTAIGLLAAIGMVGALIVRQQRFAAALAERLRNAEKVQALELQLIRAEKLATTGILAAGIAHEVGTPLGIIRARAEILMDEFARSNGRPGLEAIIAQIDRISSTIRQVLDFSRAQPVEVRAVDGVAAVHSTLELIDHRFRQQELDVQLDLPPDLPRMAADPNQFQQVLINLVLNACDACDRGGTIAISARRSDDRARIQWAVRDNGSGIPAEHLLAVFDPFFTTKKRGEGTGLGLPVAASIVRNHGGEITLSSIVGRGTTVTVSWPIAEEHVHVEG
jgi:signal transduction histidine kinase